MKQDPKENQNDEQQSKERRPFVEPEFRKEERFVDGTRGRFHNLGNS